MKFRRLIFLLGLIPVVAWGQSLTVRWANYAHDPQHTSVSVVASQPLNRVKWQTSVDLNPQYSGSSLLIHYGSPLVTAANSVIIPVKTGATDGFRVDVRNGTDGSLKYSLGTDYSLPPHEWTPSYGPALTVRNRLYWAGSGGTVYYRDRPDSDSGPTGQIAFYGIVSYFANRATFDSTVKISTPLIADRYGSVFFGYIVLGPNPGNLTSGIAKIDHTGAGTFVTAIAAAGGDSSISQIATNCALTLSNDHRTLYFAVSTGGRFGSGYLAAVSSTMLAPLARVRLVDPKTGGDAMIADSGTATPMVGPDGDVYYGVLGNPVSSNHGRGWLLHFDSTLAQTKTVGAFGWDTTPSLVASTLVPSYRGTSLYLLLTKYNNYPGVGGDGVNRIAILDPNAAELDPISEAMVMKEVIAVTGLTPDPDAGPTFPNAVREWCINSAVVDPFTKAAFVNNEDGILYRWDFTTNALTQSVVLTSGIGEAYTPTLIGVDGTVYAINNATLFAVGQ